ncbi:interferon regulatory factor 10 isoform 2-T2 [Pholidichthys leucotaenia]
MEEGAKLHLKEWLVAQIDSGRYEGLCWEDERKTMFRIPWKHAAKKDYKQTEDAALFRAWAVYKGKYREGRDKADPTMWKTRLRCALNKSTDFQEVPERNQLDISEPYKVYQIQSDSRPSLPAESLPTKDRLIKQAKRCPGSPSYQENLHHYEEDSCETENKDKPLTENLMREHTYCELTGKTNENQARTPITFISPVLLESDLRMQVMLLYQGQMVLKVTTRGSDGCFILQGHAPVRNESVYGTCNALQLSFPSPSCASLLPCMVETMNHLLCHLERGVLLWMASDGVYIKRFCQGRVYWSGPMAQHTNRPNKLEREKTFKLLDMSMFLRELQNFSLGKGPAPSYEIELCFGEEYPDPNIPKTRKLIMAQI